MSEVVHFHGWPPPRWRSSRHSEENRTERSQVTAQEMAVIPHNVFSLHFLRNSNYSLLVPNSRFMQDSSGKTLMDLITADPTPAPSSSSTSSVAASPATNPSGSLPSALGKPATEKKSKRAALMQIQNDTISAAKAALNPVRTNIMPQRQKKKVPQFLLFFLILAIIW